MITGFRVAPGGAQQLCRIHDITVVSKALGGGFPVATDFGAAKPIMDLIVRGEVFHGGVFSGNAAVMAACEAVLDELFDGKRPVRTFQCLGR